MLSNVYWSTTLWTFIGVQRFSFGRFLEYNALALDVYWSSPILNPLL
ncbi:MAG: hypothetical protein KAI83_15635 [Thiomargarita sp.]|nr:hypothetical protein [Thiomargarita sp.]